MAKKWYENCGNKINEILHRFKISLRIVTEQKFPKNFYKEKKVLQNNKPKSGDHPKNILEMMREMRKTVKYIIFPKVFLCAGAGPIFPQVHHLPHSSVVISTGYVSNWG